MEIDPRTLPLRDRYKLLIGCIVPRPIAFVSTISPDGQPNLAPFSFFSGAGSDPMSLLFCPGNRADGSEKDTLRNCKPVVEGGTGELVVNVVTEAYQRQMAATAEDLPYGESELELAGLEAVPGVHVQPPRIAESPVAFECKTLEVLRLNPGAAGGGNVVVAQVVYVHLRDDLVDDRLQVDPERLRAIGRMGGASYCTTRDRFELPRGRAALRDPGRS